MSTVSFKQYEFSRIGSVWSFKNDNSADLLLKITKHRLVKNIFQGIFQGLISMGDDIQMLEGEIKNGKFVGYSKKLQKSVEIESTLMKPVLKGEHIQRYAELKTNTYIIYPHIENEKHKTIPFEEPSFKISYPLGYEYLLNFESYLKEKKTKYKTNPKYWFTLHRSRELSIFNTSKIITPQLQNKASFTIDNSSYFPDAGGYMIVKKDNDSIDLKTYLGIFNSSLFYYFIKQTSTPYNNNYYYFKTNYIQEFSIPEISESVQSLIMKTVESVISLKNQGKDTYLNEKKIDSLVYDLYNLTHDEISIIEQCL